MFVDRGMRIKRFTPRARELFNLIAADVGRPLLDITHRLDYPELAADAADGVRDAARRSSARSTAADGRWFLCAILPYRTTEDRIDGAVLKFVDITAARKAEEQLRRSEQRCGRSSTASRDFAIITTDLEGRIDSWNDGAERCSAIAEAEIVGPADRDAVHAGGPRERRPRGASCETARDDGPRADERWHLRKDGSRFFCSGVHGAADRQAARTATPRSRAT